MPINLKAPQLKELKPRIVVCGVGGAGGNAINNMIGSGLSGVQFVVAKRLPPYHMNMLVLLLLCVK